MAFPEGPKLCLGEMAIQRIEMTGAFRNQVLESIMKGGDEWFQKAGLEINYEECR